MPKPMQIELKNVQVHSSMHSDPCQGLPSPGEQAREAACTRTLHSHLHSALAGAEGTHISGELLVGGFPGGLDGRRSLRLHRVPAEVGAQRLQPAHA